MGLQTVTFRNKFHLWKGECVGNEGGKFNGSLIEWLCGKHSDYHCSHQTMYGIQYTSQHTLYCNHCTLHIYTLHTSHWVFHTMKYYTLHTVHYVLLHTVHCTLHSLYYVTLHTARCTLCTTLHNATLQSAPPCRIDRKYVVVIQVQSAESRSVRKEVQC